MAKNVQMIVEIDENGELKIEADGTVGTECVNLLKFLDFIHGLEVIESGHTDDYKTQKVQTTSQQKIQK